MDENESRPLPDLIKNTEVAQNVGTLEWYRNKGYGFVSTNQVRAFLHIRTVQQIMPGLAATIDGGTDVSGIPIRVIDTQKAEKKHEQVVAAEIVVPPAIVHVEIPPDDSTDPHAYYKHYTSGRHDSRPSLDPRVEAALNSGGVIWLCKSANYNRKDEWVEIYSFFKNNRAGALCMLRLFGEHGATLDTNHIPSELYHDPVLNDLYMFTSHPWAGDRFVMKNALQVIARAGGYRKIILVEGKQTRLYMPHIDESGKVSLIQQEVRIDNNGIIRGESKVQNYVGYFDPVKPTNLDEETEREFNEYKRIATETTHKHRRFLAAAAEAKYLLSMLKKRIVMTMEPILNNQTDKYQMQPEQVGIAIKSLELLATVENVADITLDIATLQDAHNNTVEALVGVIVYTDGRREQVPLYVGTSKKELPHGVKVYKTPKGNVIIHPDMSTHPGLAEYERINNGYNLLEIPEDPEINRKIARALDEGRILSKNMSPAEIERLLEIDRKLKEPKLVVQGTKYQGGFGIGSLGNVRSAYVYLNDEWVKLKITSVDLMRYNSAMTVITGIDPKGNKHTTQLSTRDRGYLIGEFRALMEDNGAQDDAPQPDPTIKTKIDLQSILKELRDN